MKKQSSQQRITTIPVQEIRTHVEYILTSDVSDIGNRLGECLRLMDTEIARVKKQASGYPGNGSINAIVWFDGFTLANYCKNLADFLSTKDFLNEQLQATGLWVKATLSVCSHYHHMVGPAMIAYAEVNEHAGNKEVAKAYCAAVFKDFKCILKSAEEKGAKPVGDDLIALQSLKSAATMLVNLEDKSELQKSASKILSRIDNVMLKTPNNTKH